MITNRKWLPVVLLRLMMLASAFYVCSCDVRINEIEDNSGYNFHYQGKGGVTITWDDNSVDEWFSARELFKKYGAKCTFFVSNFCSLSQDEIRKLKILKDEGHEIACHSLTHKDAVLYYMDYGTESYIKNEILPALDSMRLKGFSPETFAYPNGSRNSETDEALLKYFRVIRGTTYGSRGVLYSWGRTRILQATGIDNSYNIQLESIYSMLKEASDSSQVAVFYGHRISDTTNNTSYYCTSRDRLEAVLKRASELHLHFYTASELDVRNMADTYSSSIKARQKNYFNK